MTDFLDTETKHSQNLGGEQAWTNHCPIKIWSPSLDINCRVALLVVGYHDCLLDGNDVNGLTDLKIRLLEAKGFKVLIIRHSDLKPKENTLDRVKMIQHRLKILLNVENLENVSKGDK